MKRLALFAIFVACRRDPEPPTITEKVTPAPIAVPLASASASASASALAAPVSYADLCARSTPRVPTTAAVGALDAELEARLDMRARTNLGALGHDGVNARKRHEILRAGALEQGLKACPLADLWEQWSKSDASL